MTVSQPSARDEPRARNGAARRLRFWAASLQRDLRSSEPIQFLACALIGGIVGACVAGLHRAVELIHEIGFLLPPGALLSAGFGVDPWRIALVPAAGGLVLGTAALLMRRRRPGDIVDPVEANALHGGRMSLTDSLRLTFSTVISNASGASLGMEAGYSQLGSGVFSRIGQYFRLRREDQRVFVTAGAAAAIAAAFNAPLTGAFYGYELVLGSYRPRALAPVVVAAVAATIAERALGRIRPLFEVFAPGPVDSFSYVLFGAIGVLAAGVAVLSMMAVTWCERGMRRLPVADWLRPMLGGAALSLIGVVFPQVMGSGHGAIQYHFQTHWALWPLIALLAAKIVASALSIGAGFRGGLFSSSLFLGCLFGAICAEALAWFSPSLVTQHNVFMLVGMGAVAAGIIGAPFTMVFLVLESTGDFPATVGVLIGVTMAATIVRLTFGYSFATWRFHQKGLAIQGAHDVGWLADLSVARMMRSDPQIVLSTMPLTALVAKYPPGSTKRVFAIDPEGKYAGSIDMAAVHDPDIGDALDEGVVADLVEHGQDFLLPRDNARVALARFEEARAESLAVIASRADRRIVGYMTEAYALRRYTQELERRRSAELGEQDLFASLGRNPGR